MAADDAATVDARGLRCPMPVIELQRVAKTSPAGRELTLLSDDPAADSDVPAWCRMLGHEMVASRPAPGGGRAYVVRLRKAGGGSSSADSSDAR